MASLLGSGSPASGSTAQHLVPHRAVVRPSLVGAVSDRVVPAAGRLLQDWLEEVTLAGSLHQRSLLVARFSS